MLITGETDGVSLSAYLYILHMHSSAQHIYIIIYGSERLWLHVLGVSGNTVVGHVDQPINPGLLFGQLIQIPIHDIVDVTLVHIIG